MRRGNSSPDAMSADSSSAGHHSSDVVLHSRRFGEGRETASRARGISVSALDAFTTLVVSTANSVYRVTVLKPSTREVVVQGGAHFPERSRAFLHGASGGGKLFKLGWIGVGLHLEFQAVGRRIVTSRVRTIAIEPLVTGPPS